MISKITKPTSLRAFLFLTLISSLFILYIFKIISSWQVALVWGVVICINLWFLYLLTIPKEFGKIRLRRITVLMVTSLFLFVTSQVKLIKLLSKGLLDNTNKLLKDNNLLGLSQTEFFVIISLICTSALLFFFNFILQDKTVMKEHGGSFDLTFPEREFDERLRSFCNYLLNRIDVYDNEANWSDAHFTALDAEVETFTNQGKESKVTNLIKAIKNDYKSKVFLVLGDPGSGKSVALRKLCRDLIKEVLPTKKIPVYLNLKEWFSSEKWSEENPPSPANLYEFCIGSLKSKDIFADEFIDKYFNRLYENGHLFFIIDSFDEIPAVLDVDESSWLIDKLSEILFNFLGGAHESRGVLASRYFRKPTNKFKSTTLLNVRPFSHLKINEALNKYIAIDKSIIKLIFGQRSDLLPIASNPFAVGLIYSFLKDNDNNLPKNQSDLFSSYINSRLQSCSRLIEKHGFTKQIVLHYSIEISTYMLNKANFGLEASLDELKTQFQKVNIENVIEILAYARIGRIGKGEEKRFSFVHRRFNEYFIVQKYLETPSLIEIESIAIDSRFRDSLILYCEIAPDDVAIGIAEFCWSEIKLIDENNIVQFKRSIHCLRFLVEAYRLRLNLLESFKNDLSKLILTIIENYKDYKYPIITKVSVEAIGILEQSDMQKALIKCFTINNWWINQTAMQACKHLTSISQILEDKIIRFIQFLDYFEFLNQKDELFFTLSLADTFKNLKKYSLLRYFDIIAFFTLFSIGIIANPPIGLTLLLSYIGIKYLSNNPSKYYMVTLQFRMLMGLNVLTHVAFFHSIAKPLIQPQKNFFTDLFQKIDFSNQIWSAFFNLNHTLSISFLIITSCLLLPLLDVYFMFKQAYNIAGLKGLKWKEIFKKTLHAIGYFVVVALIMAVIGSIVYFLSKVKYFDDILTYGSLSVMLAFLLGLIAFAVRDYLKYRTITNNNYSFSRKNIAHDYRSFKLELFKNKFVLKLQNEGGIPNDKWPDDFTLIGISNSIIILSQLDEKWLGLD